MSNAAFLTHACLNCHGDGTLADAAHRDFFLI